MGEIRRHLRDNNSIRVSRSLRDIAYKAIASKNSVKILFREHVVLNEGKITKKYDFIMLYGNFRMIEKFGNVSTSQGGSFIKVTHYYLNKEEN